MPSLVGSEMCIRDRERSSHRLCAVAIGRYWHRRDRRGGMSRGRGGGRTRPRPWDPRRGVNPPGRWSRGPAEPKATVESRGCSTSCCCCTPASPCGDTVRRRLHRRGRRRSSRGRGGRGRPVASTLSVPYVRLGEGVGWATAVAAAGASAEPVPTPVGTTKSEAKSLSAAGKARPRPGQRSTMATDAETRATNLPEGE